MELLDDLVKVDKDCCAIMFSSYRTKEMVSIALDKGAKGYVTKPFTPETLLLHANHFIG